MKPNKPHIIANDTIKDSYLLTDTSAPTVKNIFFK